jgi:predicted secreted protein
VLLGDGGSPESFGMPCGFTERSFSRTKEMGESVVPDCSDEDAASFTERDITSKSASISGTGVLDASAADTWEEFWNSDTSRNVRVELWRSGVKRGHWAGAFQLESLEFGATKGERVTITASLMSDGSFIWVPV